MAIINPETGQKMVRDVRDLRGKSGGLPAADSGRMSLDKAKEFFELSVKRLGTRDSGPAPEYIITGVPREANKFLGKMEFYVDSEKWAPHRILMYAPNGQLMNDSSIEYQQVSGVWVPKKNRSTVNTPMGKMEIEMEYENVKVNAGMGDGEFGIE